jgi:hypothetical protein
MNQALHISIERRFPGRMIPSDPILLWEAGAIAGAVNVAGNFAAFIG